MFSEAQHTDSEVLLYTYCLDQNPDRKEEKTPSCSTHVYEENGFYYCATASENGVYWYSYCLNNPLVYTDPDGEFFIGTAITFVGDFFKTLFTGGLNRNKATRHDAWREFDPSADWSPTNRAFKIDWGGLKTDPNRTIFGRGLQLISRYTREIGQTIAGKIFSHGRNIVGDVDEVTYYGGATLVNSHNTASTRWGLTLGPYINGNRLKANPYTDQLFRHEFGHTLQSQLVGSKYLYKVGLPSLVGAFLDYDFLHINNHDYEWYETQANRMAERYFNNHDPNALNPTKGGTSWNYTAYPTNYKITWYWIFAHPDKDYFWWLFF